MRQGQKAYDELGEQYLVHRQFLKSEGYVRKFCNKLPKNATVLDVGCGAGVPVDDLIVKAGHQVVGIDLSERMIAIARRRVKEAQYQVFDMCNLSERQYEVDGVVCLFALFHVPRSEHKKLVKVMASFLPKNGWLLISMGDRPFEGEHEMYGVTSYSSQWGSTDNRQIVVKAGFRIMEEAMLVSGGERHQMILAQKT